MPRLSLDSWHRRTTEQRMLIVTGALLLCSLIIIARLIELQIVRGMEYQEIAYSQHYGGVTLPARRGEVLSLSSKTGETSILATNTTLDLVYVDPLITDDATFVAETLAEILVTDAFHEQCIAGTDACPNELIRFYGAAFDPLERMKNIQSGALLEPIPEELPNSTTLDLPDRTEVTRRFARSIEERISEKRVTYVPLVYGATKKQMEEVSDTGTPGIEVAKDSNLIYANPEEVPQLQVASIARKLSSTLQMDAATIQQLLRSRPLRYVPVMRRLPPSYSLRIKEAKLQSLKETQELRSEKETRGERDEVQDPLRSVALIPEHWRLYPDTTIASHVVGFLDTNQQPQYGVERTFDPQLRGQEGRIATVSDLEGGQILTNEQTIVDPKDGDTIVLTIDRIVQKYVEELMDQAVRDFKAESGQAIIMEPSTGRIIAMVNAPIFDSNKYANVFDKVPILLDEGQRKTVVVEIYHPETHEFVIRAYVADIFTAEGRKTLSEESQKKLAEIEELYDLEDITRYYHYIGETSRREVFPTDREDVWLRYANNIGVGAYLNRTIQEIYEPGSVLKPVTMAIALDQGEVTPSDTYDDFEPVEVDEYTIRNALNRHFGTVTMTQCLDFSVNTCMTSVSARLGKKLFHRMLERFGIGRITGIELEDELPGEILPWRKWSNSLLATAAYGQGISVTPLQMITAFSALANGGKLMRPTIIERVVHSDGTVEETKPMVVDQVITQETSDTITAMLVSGGENGFARAGRVPGYRIAGKTGTSQIAGPGGKYETGTGSSITSFAGYAPVDNPKFVILIKFDRTRRKDAEYGGTSSAPLFGKIAAFLFGYYGIQPDAL